MTETIEPVKKVSRLLDLIKRPQQAKRKPSNFALYWAWLFYNLVALLFDIIAAGTVYGLTEKIAYAVLTFTAGFMPLLMHEFLYTRAYASGKQRVIAILGAGLSVVTILAVGVIAGIVNVLGLAALTAKMLEIVLIVTLVLVAGAHGLLAAIYFYVDDGIKANQVRAESVAYHERRIEDINRAKEILALAEQGATEEDKLTEKYGGAEVLNEILEQLRGSAISTTAEPEPQAAQPSQTVKPITKPITSEAAEMQPVPLPWLFNWGAEKSKNGNGHDPNA